MEGQGTPVLEALANGLPVVAYDIPPVREISDESRLATFVPVGDVAALTEKVIQHVDDPQGAYEIARAARDNGAANYALGVVAERLESQLRAHARSGSGWDWNITVPCCMNLILLSPLDISDRDSKALLRVLDGGWIAPLGPEVDAFEEELAAVTGRSHGVAPSSGTAALHLALLLQDVGLGGRVLDSTLTFSATLNAIRYAGAEPVFIDSNIETWNMDPSLVARAVADGSYAACIPVDIYGQCADYSEIEPLRADAGIPIIEDAAEALGASYGGRTAGSFGGMAALSFNGNKIITTSGGGALVTDDGDWAERARFLATQARDPTPHYEHSEIGYNYRMSNLLAALGRWQLSDPDRRVEARRTHNQVYRQALGNLPGVEFMPEAPDSFSTFWLTCLTIDPERAGTDREGIRLHLESLDIESRPAWKPMHLQPVFEGCETYGGDVSALLFQNGFCLPSGSSMTEEDRQRVIAGFREALGR